MQFYRLANFTYWSTDYLSSGIIALMFGLAPLISGLIGRFVFQMQLSLNQWLGMGIALTGLSVICLGDADQHIQPIGIVIALVGVLVYCVSMFWVKKINAPIDPMAQAAGSIGLSVVFYRYVAIYLAIRTHCYATCQVLIWSGVCGNYGFADCDVLLFQTGTEN